MIVDCKNLEAQKVEVSLRQLAVLVRLGRPKFPTLY